MSKRSNDAPGKVVVTVGQVEHLATGFAKTWQRPPADYQAVAQQKHDIYFVRK